MKQWIYLLGCVLMAFIVSAQDAPLVYINSEKPKTDKKGRTVEVLDYKRRLDMSKGLISAKAYREEIAERQRLEKVAKECGPWFEAVQLLEDSQNDADERYGGGGEATDSDNIGQTGYGIVAYIEAMRVFNSNAEEGGSVSKEVRQLRAALEELLYRRGGEVLCGPGRGVDMRYPLELLLVRYQSWKAQRLPVEELYAAKSADLWPGAIPKEAQRVTKTVRLYPGEGGHISTGLYVPPGEVITIKCSSLAGNLSAQIGCHSDALNPKIVPLDENGDPLDDPYNPVAPNLSKIKMGWQKVTDNRPLWRWPDMVRRFKIDKRSKEIGHVLGGVLWLQWSGGKRPMDVEISGCVQMPWFRLGLDTDEDWQERISKYPAPWAEIQTKTIIFTVQTKVVKNIKDMTALAQWWGKASCMMYRFAGYPLPTDKEAHNYRSDKREWALLDDTLVQLNPVAPPDAEERFREAGKKTEDKDKQEAEVKKLQEEEGISKEEALARVNRYGVPEEEAEPIDMMVPIDTSGPKAMKQANRETEAKFTATRIVDDTQISIGAGHSGYPIMAMIWGPGMMNLKGIQQSGSWGALHEMGHNLGNGATGIFELPGNGEVICNFYGTCVMRVLNGTQFPRIRASAWTDTAKKHKEGQLNWMSATVFERLVFYMTLAHYFGVESVVKVAHDRYDKYPANTVADRLCCAWSKAVKRDLTPYFEIWGLPLSKATYTFVQDWPMWPTAEEKATLFTPPESTYRYREGQTGDDTTPLVISNPEDVPTRRQLREGAFRK